MEPAVIMTSQSVHSIALDVGGTSLRSAVVASDGAIYDDTDICIAIDSKGDRESVLSTFAELLRRQFAASEAKEIRISGIGIGMPGPFDYPGGISLIRGVDKYESIYGVNLRKEFRKRLDLPKNFPILFENDAWAFTRGEAWCGAGRGYNRIVGITLGTGMGSGYLADGDILESGAGIPPLAWIGGTAYGCGVLDDRISRRGINGRYRDIVSKDFGEIDVSDIANLARDGDAAASQVFSETGDILGKGIVPYVTAFQAECVILGGQIAYAFDLFGTQVAHALTPHDIHLKKAEHIDISPLLGAGQFVFKSI
jgi:glucokinase